MEPPVVCLSGRLVDGCHRRFDLVVVSQAAPLDGIRPFDGLYLFYAGSIRCDHGLVAPRSNLGGRSHGQLDVADGGGGFAGSVRPAWSGEIEREQSLAAAFGAWHSGLDLSGPLYRLGCGGS